VTPLGSASELVEDVAVVIAVVFSDWMIMAALARIVRPGHRFAANVIFSARNLRGPSADRRETLPRHR